MQYGDCYTGAYFETIFDLLFLASQPLSFLSFPALYRLLFVSSLSQAMAPLAYCLALVLGCCKSEEDSNHGLHSTKAPITHSILCYRIRQQFHKSGQIPQDT